MFIFVGTIPGFSYTSEEERKKALNDFLKQEPPYNEFSLDHMHEKIALQLDAIV